MRRQKRAGRQRGFKPLAIAAVLLFALASVKVVASPHVRQPVATFIHFYEATEALPDVQDMSLWDRVLYSVLMTRSAS